MLGLCWCARLSLAAAGRGCSLVVVHGLLIVVTSLVAECGLWGLQASVAAARMLSTCHSWALEHRLRICGARA